MGEEREVPLVSHQVSVLVEYRSWAKLFSVGNCILQSSFANKRMGPGYPAMYICFRLHHNSLSSLHKGLKNYKTVRPVSV